MEDSNLLHLRHLGVYVFFGFGASSFKMLFVLEKVNDI
jgi:hypothetical protein